MRMGVLLVVAACGSSPPAQVEAPPLASLVSPREGAGDVQVATVNGRPVWGSCVAHQRKSVEDGLADCIGFELMAQAAEARHLERTPAVEAAAKTAMVGALVAREFEAKVTSFADFHGLFDDYLAKREKYRHRPELRGSSYARANVPPGDDAKAHAAMEHLAAGLRDQTGLMAPMLADAAERERAATGLEIVHYDYQISERLALDASYAAPLFAIPEVGRITGPVRTRWGWDVILWTGGLPAREQTAAEQAAELFPELRRQYFVPWVESIRRALNLEVVIDDKQLEASAGS